MYSEYNLYSPKLLVQKKRIYNKFGHFRYANPIYTKTKGVRMPSFVFTIGDRPAYSVITGKIYPNLTATTEKQLVYFLHKNFGAGEYLLLAYALKRNGPYTFWKGEITDQGFRFAPKTYNKRDIERAQRRMDKTESESDALDIEEEINMTKEFEKEIIKGKKYGFAPYLRASGKRGVFHMWDEPDEGLTQDFMPMERTSRRDIENMSIDDLNQA